MELQDMLGKSVAEAESEAKKRFGDLHKAER
jgi:hypothetical protein